MGLDWIPIGKPKPGQEAEFERLFDEVCMMRSEDESLWERWFEIQISPYETLGAPRVGVEPEATKWAEALYPQRTKKELTLPQFIEGLQGLYVLDLLPANDGLPVYSNGQFAGRIDLHGFRGQILKACQDVLEDDLIDAAWGSYLPADLAEYGNRLRKRADAFAKKNNLADVLDRREPPDGLDDLEHPAMQVHIVSSAAKWCLFWSERGHGMHADF